MIQRKMIFAALFILLFLPINTSGALTVEVEEKYSSTDVLTTNESSNIYRFGISTHDKVYYNVSIIGNGTFRLYLSQGRVDYHHYYDEEYSADENVREFKTSFKGSKYFSGAFTIFIESSEDYNITYHITVEIEENEIIPTEIVCGVFIMIVIGFFLFRYWWRKREPDVKKRKDKELKKGVKTDEKKWSAARIAEQRQKNDLQTPPFPPVPPPSPPSSPSYPPSEPPNQPPVLPPSNPQADQPQQPPVPPPPDY